MDPTEMSPPETMPTNNWWDLGAQAIQSATDIALARVNGQRAATGGYLSTTNPNPPPGGFGINPQAAATPGGVPTSTRNPVALLASTVGVSPGLLILLVVGVVAWKFLR